MDLLIGGNPECVLNFTFRLLHHGYPLLGRIVGLKANGDYASKGNNAAIAGNQTLVVHFSI
jgi:hypothetical protein